MRQVILDYLKQIEQNENCRILLAVESGSRAWGFESPDSDYDVRFIYVRPIEEYLKLEPIRDVIELPINDVLDINGWDLKKALQLLHKSNPTVFEWFSSPIVYMCNPLTEKIRAIMQEYFSPKNVLWHYLSMARNNEKAYLQGETVKVKKYFYVLRPLLACRWILENGTQPPMRFDELVDAELEEGLKGEVCRLLDLKMNVQELKEIPRVESLHAYIDRSMNEIEQRVQKLPRTEGNDWEPLDEFFLSVLRDMITEADALRRTL